MTVNQAIADATVLQRMRLLEIESEAVRLLVEAYLWRVGPILRELHSLQQGAEAQGRLFGAAERARIMELRRALDDATKAAHDEMRQIMLASMQAGVRQSLGMAGVLQSALPARLADEVTAVSLADAAQAIFMPVGGLRWTDRLARDLVEQHSRLQAILGSAAKTGAPMDAVAEQIKTATTIVETYRGRFVAIARTEVQRVSNAAALRVYEANHDIIKGYQWLATLDSRTCLTCAGLHEQTWAVDEDYPVPPAHPRCRCFLVPITRSWHELGMGSSEDERRELDGRAASSMDFDAWLRRQDLDTQHSVLGSQEAVERWKAGASLAALAAPRIAAIR